MGDIDIWRLAIKPGKPLAFGNVKGTAFFGLPGNPVSTFVTCRMIALPYLRRCQGQRDIGASLAMGDCRFLLANPDPKGVPSVRLIHDDIGNLRAEAFVEQSSGVMSSVSGQMPLQWSMWAKQLK